MSCPWKEEMAQRFAEGVLDPPSRQAFAGHLSACETCRERVARAQRLEGLLRTGITPLPAPAALASRVAGALAAGRERQPRPIWRRPALARALAGLAVALVLALAAYAVAPGAVLAIAQRLLFFVPGLGIKTTDENTLVATGPVSVQTAGTIFTVHTLLSDGQRTVVQLDVTGLPGRKAGWHGIPGATRRTAFLRLDNGERYSAFSVWSNTGGSPEESRVRAELRFPSLPPNLRSVELVVPMDSLVPPALLPGSDQLEWTARIELVSPAQSSLPPATRVSASASLHGVSLRVTACSAGPERTVVLLESEPGGTSRVAGLGKMCGTADDVTVTLRDDQGRSYNLAPHEAVPSLDDAAYRRDLYFVPLQHGARQLTLEVAAVVVREEGTASVTIPLAGRKPGDAWILDRTVELGRYQVHLKSATLVEEQGQLELYFDVDLGPTVDGRTLATFDVLTAPAQSRTWEGSFGQEGSTQLVLFGVQVEPGSENVTIRLDRPYVNVDGPWVLTFPVRGP